LGEKALELYGGRYLIYVGEGRGGVNATAQFFDELEANWECIRIVPVMPFPQNFEKMFIMRSKHSPKRSWFSWFR
jgi:chemotaxis response regulator CheB